MNDSIPVAPSPPSKFGRKTELKCLHCGALLARLASRPARWQILPEENSFGEATDPEMGGSSPFFRCVDCDAKNYLIREYSNGACRWGLSHAINGTNLVIDDGSNPWIRVE